MTTTIAAADLARIAPSLDTTAREAAHSAVDVTAPEAERVNTFVDAYLRALAGQLGAQSAEQRSAGEEWAPADWLQGDSDSIVEHAALLGVADSEIDWRSLWRAYKVAA